MKKVSNNYDDDVYICFLGFEDAFDKSKLTEDDEDPETLARFELFLIARSKDNLDEVPTA